MKLKLYHWLVQQIQNLLPWRMLWLTRPTA